MNNKFLSLLALILAAAITLQAQLVPAPKKTTSSEKVGNSKTGRARRALPIPAKAAPHNLPDLVKLWGEGQLATVKGRFEDRNLRFFHLRMEELLPESSVAMNMARSGAVKAGEEARYYVLTGHSVFKSQGRLSLSIHVAQTKEQSRAWLDGEFQTPGALKEDDAEGRLAFLFPKVSVALTPGLHAEFVPFKVHAVAYEGASTIKKIAFGQTAVDLPLSLDGVLVVAEDEGGLCKGLFKFPAWDYTLPLSGVKIHGEFLLESDEPRAICGTWIVRQNGFNMDRPGFVGPRPFESHRLRVRWSGKDVAVSFSEASGANFNWGADLHEQSSISAGVEAEKLVTLPGLQAAYEKNWSRGLWTEGDDPDSFVNAADLAFSLGGLRLHMPIQYDAGNGIQGDNHRRAVAAAAIIQGRAKAANMKTVPWLPPPNFGR